MKKIRLPGTRKYIKNLLKDAEMDTKESFYLEVNEDGELSVTGCNEIINYTGENIMLKSEKYYLDIYGTDLFLVVYSENSSVIKGDIEDIKFLRVR